MVFAVEFVQFCVFILSDPLSYRGKGHRTRHPPGLKGREIGLWYASRYKEKNVKTDRQSVRLLTINALLLILNVHFTHLVLSHACLANVLIKQVGHTIR